MTPEQQTRAEKYASIPDDVWALLRDDLWAFASGLQSPEQYGVAKAVTYIELQRSAKRRAERRTSGTTRKGV